MIKDYSYGIIPIYINSDGEYEFLLINQKTYNGSFWGFPKGHAEDGEDGLTAAKRELYEEVGIVNIEINMDSFGGFSYTFEENNEKYDKTVKYRLGFVTNKEVKIQQEELNGYKRANYDDTLNVLSYKNMKEVFIKITKDLFVIK